MVWAWNLVCGRFMNFQNSRKISNLLTFGCPSHHQKVVSHKDSFKLNAHMVPLYCVTSLLRPCNILFRLFKCCVISTIKSTSCIHSEDWNSDGGWDQFPLTYLLCSVPCFKCKEDLEAFDTAIRIYTEKIRNVTFGKDSWSQASLPIRHGGLGLRSAADLSLPSFLSSSFACQGLVNRLLPSLTLPHGEVISATDAWSILHDSSPRQKETQSAWDGLVCRDSLAALLDTPSPWNHCQLLTAQNSHTAAWSKAFLVASSRSLSPDELRIAIALQTGANVFESTECRSGKFVDGLGLHGLSCIDTLRASVRYIRTSISA